MIKVVLIDDHPIVRAGMRAILACTNDIEIVGEGSNQVEALDLVSRFHPDVLVLDVELPDGSGLDVTTTLKNDKDSSTSVLILTAHNDPQLIFNLLRNGAIGYVLKDEALETLAGAIRSAASGKSFLSPSVAGQVIQKAINEEVPIKTLTTDIQYEEELTPREKDILKLLAEGLDNKDIAERLTLTKRTVQNHISTIYGKLGLKTRTEAMLYALNHRISRKT